MPSARTMCAGVSSEQRVFCFGGREGKFEEGGVLSSALAYDPRTSRWDELPPMSAKRYGAAAVTMGSSIYVVGGKDSEVRGTAIPSLGETQPRTQNSKPQTLNPKTSENLTRCGSTRTLAPMTFPPCPLPPVTPVAPFAAAPFCSGMLEVPCTDKAPSKLTGAVGDGRNLR